MSGCALFHVQHLLGIGHAMRIAAVARATAARGIEVTVLSGGGALGLDWGSARVIALPAARAPDGDFRTLVDGENRPLDAAFHERRRGLVLKAFRDIQPDVVLLESYPFGRRAFRFELDALIEAAKASDPLVPVLVSIRDILVAKTDPSRIQEIVRRINSDIDAVLVHGDPNLVPLSASFSAAREISGKIQYTGYVLGIEPDSTEFLALNPSPPAHGEILVSAGGGAVGAPLLRAALAARPLTSVAQRPWRLIAGPNLPQADYAQLAAGLPAGVTLERFRSDFQERLRHCHLSLSQAGYNTILDVLQAGVRAVVVPFAAGGETEQALRARVLAERGLVHVAEPDDLSGPALAAAIERALAAPAPERLSLAFDGARQAAERVAAFAAGAGLR
jgi:predicted glycosyltransferase